MRQRKCTLIAYKFKSAAVATLAKARLMTRRVSRSNPGAATFALMTRVTIGRQSCKVEKERLSPTTPASVMITLALIGAWHNSLDRMPAVILVSPLLNYFLLYIR